MTETPKHKEFPLEDIKNEALQLYREYHLAVSEDEPDDKSKEQVQKLADADFKRWQKNTKLQLIKLKEDFPAQDPYLYLYSLEYLLGHFDEIHNKAVKTWKNSHRAVEPVSKHIRHKVHDTLNDNHALN